LVERLDVAAELLVDVGGGDVADGCEQATAVSITPAVATGNAARRRSISLLPNTLGSSSDICGRVVVPTYDRNGERAKGWDEPIETESRIL